MVNLQARFDEGLSSLQLHAAVSLLLWKKAGDTQYLGWRLVILQNLTPYPAPAPLTQAWELSSDI